MNQREIKHKAKHVLEAHLQCAAAQSWHTGEAIKEETHWIPKERGMQVAY
jgi:hypothetical protein